MKAKNGYVRHLHQCKRFRAGDNCLLRETLHPGKGGEAATYSLAHAVVKPGVTTLWHSLKKSSEVYFIISGRGLMRINSRAMPVKPGSTVYIPPGARQCIKNTSRKDLVFVCMVSPPWRMEDEEIFGVL